MTSVGHNGQLRQFVERIERLETDQREIDADKKEVYAEAKATGYDVKILKKVIAERRKDPDKRAEEEALMELYKAALGMIPTDEDLGIESITLTRAPAREAEIPASIQPTTSQQPAGAEQGDGAAPVAREAAVAAPEPEWPEIPPFMDRRQR